MALEKISTAAARLTCFVERAGIIEPADRTWAFNRIIECCGVAGSQPDFVELYEGYDFEADLAVLAEAGVSAGYAEDTATGRDRLAMRIMGALLPRPSEMARHFTQLLETLGPQAATDWFYRICVDADYVRASAIARNIAWEHESRWGTLEITINKSKPEKDPRDIAAAGAAPAGEAYPACQLCVENEGYAGRPAADPFGPHPARQNLRIIPIELGGERWGFQYSPYAYFTEHCIAMSSEHRPMHIDRAAITCLLDFVDLFPHYFIGSNADLPIVGGSILSHDHFQGGRHVFPMMKAPVVEEFRLIPFLGVRAGVVSWPMSVLRLACEDRGALLEAAIYVTDAWRAWTDESVGIRAVDEDGTLHNTVTPICRRVDGEYVLDLALRCNVTTDEHPLGVFHPHEDKWHVKKENIGLIEVMGLAILPPRLETAMDEGSLTREEIGTVFSGVLEDAGVFKWDNEGREALHRFLDSL